MSAPVRVARVLAATALLVSVGFAITMETFETKQAIDSPIQALNPRSANAALNSARAHYDPLYLDQLAEAQVNYVRGLIARNSAPSTIGTALDEIAAWSRRATPMREQAANINALENMARSNPGDVGLRVAIARYWIRQMEVERDEIPSDRPRMFRLWVKTKRWECLNCYVQRGPRETGSTAFLRAEAAVQAALAASPSDPGALFAASQLWNMMFEEPLGTAEAKSIEYAKRAAAQHGPEAAAATVFVLERDNRVAKLEERVAQLRGIKAVKSVKIWSAFRNNRPDPVNDIYKPVFRNASPQELAEANATEQQALALKREQRAELESSVQHNPLAADVFRILAEWPANLNTDEQERMEKERILRYALLLAPTDWRLEWDRAANWAAVEQHKLEAAASIAQDALRKYPDTNFIPMYDQAADKLAADAFGAYTFALQAVRREPASPFAHQRLALALRNLVGRTIDGVPMLPDAANRTFYEVKLTYYAAVRHLGHPEAWRDANTRHATEQVIEWAKARMARPPEAR